MTAECLECKSSKILLSLILIPTLIKTWLILPFPPFLVLHTLNDMLMTQPVVTFDPKVSSAPSELRHTLMISCVSNVPTAVQGKYTVGTGASAFLETGDTASHSHSANQEKRVTQCLSD